MTALNPAKLHTPVQPSSWKQTTSIKLVVEPLSTGVKPSKSAFGAGSLSKAALAEAALRAKWCAYQTHQEYRALRLYGGLGLWV